MPPPDCPFCEHQNPADAKFCNECGSPLHLTPCGDCGAVNSVADPHCWRCGGLLLPLDSPVPVEPVERKLVVPEQLPMELLPTAQLPTEQELEQELVALEQEVQALERAPASAEALPPVFEHAPRGSGTPGPKAGDPQPRRVEQASRGSNIPEPKSLFVQADDAPRGRWHGFITAASVVVFVAAIAGGGYLYYRLGASPAREGPSLPPPEPPPAEASMEPRVAGDVGAAPEPVPAPAVASAAPRVDAPVEPPVISDAGKAPEAEPAREGGGAANIITQIGKGTSAREPTCPAAVAAMALCEWVVKAHRR